MWVESFVCESPFLWNWHAQSQSAFGFRCSCLSKKATSCGSDFVKCCMPVKAASHRVMTLVLTLQGIFKENRTELGACFRLHNVVVGYHMPEHQQGAPPAPPEACAPLAVCTVWCHTGHPAPAALQLHKSHRWEVVVCHWDLLRKSSFHILVVCPLLGILSFQYYPHHFTAENSPY